MMVKKELLAEPPASPSAAIHPSAEGVYLVTAVIREFHSSKLLELCIWSHTPPAESALCARVFLSTKEKRCMTHLYGRIKYVYGKRANGFSAENSPRWTEASLENLLDIYPHSRGYSSAGVDAFFDEKGGNAVKKYFREHKKEPLSIVGDFQQKLMAARRDKRTAAEREATEKLMAQVKELPANWDDFIDNGPLLSSRYIIYERTKSKKIIGFCTYCGNTVALKEAHHNEKGVCPACGSQVRTKSRGITSSFGTWTRASYLQKLHDGSIILRLFECSRRFDACFKAAEHIFEMRRYHISTIGNVVMYDRYNGRWRRRGTMEYYASVLYPQNVRSVLSDTIYRYSALDVFAEANKPVSVIGWLGLYAGHRQLEYLPKLRLFSLACDISLGNSYVSVGRGASIKECLPFEKQDIAYFAETDMSSYEISTFTAYKKRGYFIGKEYLHEFRKKQINPQDYLVETIMAMKVNPFKLFRYIERQKKSNFSRGAAMQFWKDYVSMARAEHYDLTDEYYLFPHNLSDMHDEVNELRLLQSMEQKESQIGDDVRAVFDELAQEYAAFAWSSEKYTIHAPTSLRELIHNGTKLKICVANPSNGYIKAYCEQKKILFFVQRAEKPGDPYVVFEMTMDGHLGQTSAIRNESPSADVKAAIQEWKRAVAMPEIKRRKIIRQRIVIEVQEVRVPCA